ncbi:autotransporter-associated beta strand repeat-containing protein [Chitinispirillales bacterium ANBcel5]|uniref:autotransporter-associated beta strand repeat-containing protein n=1 Tax=Cellulosispirillum alkaliphilum TaxID=3039283 RepID=UPI002A5066B3|nr:autotransporter-associated beta strand repeat-containing protein [Chitinispirillales bacterium ANBcel5]
MSNKRLLLFTLQIILLVLFHSNAQSVVTINTSGEGDYIHLDSCLSAIALGTITPDTVVFTDEVQQTHQMYSNITRTLPGPITFKSRETDPDKFPILQNNERDYFDFFINNDIYFENLIFTGSVSFSSGNAENRIHSFKNCVFRDFSSPDGVYKFHGDKPTVAEFVNCIFHDNDVVFTFDRWGLTNATFKVINCTFDGNINVHNNSNTELIDNFSFINNIYSNNGSIFPNNNYRAKASYSLSDESVAEYGTGSIQGDPDYKESVRTLPGHWQITRSSPAVNIGTSSTAPLTDIGGFLRLNGPDAGAWESPSNTYWWDADAQEGIQAGSGTWGTDDFWTRDGGESRVAWPGDGYNAVFSGDNGTYTVTIDGTQGADSVAFLNSEYTISGGIALNLGEGGIFVNDGNSAAIATAITGTDGLKITSAGAHSSLSLNEENSFTGPVSIGPTVSVRASTESAFGSSENVITVLSGGAIDINATSLQGYSNPIVINGQVNDSIGAIYNSGGEQKWALGQIELGSNASVGSNEGRFDIGRDVPGLGIIGNNHVLTKIGSSLIALLSEATDLAGLEVNGGEIIFEADNAAGSAPVTVNSSGMISTFGNRTVLNDITINGGIIASPLWESHPSLYTGAFTLNDSATLNVVRSDDSITISGNIGGNGKLLKYGEGTLVLSAPNTFTGGLRVYEGNVAIADNMSLGSAEAILDGTGARLLINDNVTIANDIRLKHSEPGIGMGTLHGPSGEGEPAEISGTVTIESTTLNGGHIHGGNTTGALLFSGPIVAEPEVEITQRSGNLIFAGGGSYFQLHLGEHIIELGADDGISPTAVIHMGYLDDPGVLDFDMKGYNQTLAGLFRYKSSTTTLTNSSSEQSILTLNVADTNSFDYPGTITGNISLVKEGGGIQAIGGANSFTGNTTVNGGVIALSGSLYNNGTIAAELIINDGGTVRLDENHVLGAHSSFPATKAVVNDGGVLASNQNYTTLNNLSLNGGTLLSKGGLDNTWGAFSLKGTVTVSGNSTSSISTGIGNYNYIFIGTNSNGGATTFDVENNTTTIDLTVTTPLSDNRETSNPFKTVTSGLIKTGSGIMSLDEANTYTGPTTISGGTLLVNGSTASESNVTVESGAALGGSGTVQGDVSVQDGGRVTPGNLGPGTLSTGALTLNSYSELHFELGTNSDSIKVDGNLVLNGTLHVSAVEGFGVGTYTLLTHTGNYSGSGVTVGTMPAGYSGSVSHEGSSVILTVSASSGPQVIDLSPPHQSEDVELNTPLAITFDQEVTTDFGTVTVRRFEDNSIFEQFDVMDSRVAADSVIHDFETDNEGFTENVVSVWNTDRSFQNDGSIRVTLPQEEWSGRRPGSVTWTPYDSITGWVYTSTPEMSGVLYVMTGDYIWVETEVISLPQNTWTRIALNLNDTDIDKSDVKEYGFKNMTTAEGIFYIDRISLKRNASQTVTILPSQPFEPGGEYYVEIDSTAFKTLSSEYFEGMSSSANWKFTSEYGNMVWDVSSDPGFQSGNGTWGIDEFWAREDGDGTNLGPWPGAGNTALFSAGEEGGGYSDGHSSGSLDGWTMVGSRTTWNENGGVMSPGNQSASGFLLNDYPCADDGEFTVVFKYPPSTSTNSHHGGAIFRSNETATSYYAFNLFIQTQDGYHANNAIRFKKNSTTMTSEFITIADGLDFTGLNSTYPVKVKLNGNTFTFYFNGDSVGVYTDTDTPHLSGNVGYFYSGQYNIYCTWDSSSWVDASSGSAPGPYTVSVSDEQSVSTIIFSAQGYTLDGGTINMTGMKPSIYTSAKAHITSQIRGSNGLNKLGLDTLILSGTNTWSGGTTISQGFLQIGNGSTSGTLPGNVVNNSVLIFNRSDSFTFNGHVSGSGMVSVQGGADVVVSGELTHNGGTRIANESTLRIGDHGSGGAVYGDILNSGILIIQKDSDLIYNSVVSGTGSILKTGNGTLFLTDNNTHTGLTTVSSGTLSVNGSLSSSNLTVESGAQLSGNGTLGGSVTVDDGGSIKPGYGGAGKLSTGNLSLSQNSILDIKLGTNSDTVAVSGDLTLNGVLHISESSGFRAGVYTILTYSGSLTDHEINIGDAPSGYRYSINASGGTVTITVQSDEWLLPITVNTNTQQCTVYTDNWTLIFDNTLGGGISLLTDSSQAQYSGTTENQTLNGSPLYFVDINGTESGSSGEWELLQTTPFFARVRQYGTINDLNYTIDYTVYGSGTIYIKTTLHNNTSSPVSSSVYRHGIARKASGNTIHFGNPDPSLSPFVLITTTEENQFNLLMSTKDLWNADSGAANSATSHFSSGNVSAGYELANPVLEAGQKQVWEKMIFFSKKDWTSGDDVTPYVSDYRNHDTLSFLAGNRAMEKAWENHIEGHWTFDEGSGNQTYDYSGNNRTGTISGATWVDGKWDGGLNFSLSDNVNTGNISKMSGTGSFTVMAWIRPSAQLSPTTAIFSKYTEDTGYRVSGDNGRLAIKLNSTFLTGTRDLGTGKWHHVAIAVDRGRETVTMFVDGRKDRIFSGENYTVSVNSSNVLIGDGFSGDIDDVRFYNEGVSGSSVKAIYQRGYRSAEGVYQLRADDNNTVHVVFDGSTLSRRFPVLKIGNYWAEDLPLPGAVVLDGEALVEGDDYYAYLNNNTLFVGLNRILSRDKNRLFIHSTDGSGSVAVKETRKMNWGVYSAEGIYHVWMRNSESAIFSDTEPNQFYLNWKMDYQNAPYDHNGELWRFKSSNVTGSSPDTSGTNNLTDVYTPLGNIQYYIRRQWLNSMVAVQEEPAFAVVESSAVRVILKVGPRRLQYSAFLDLTTYFTVYPKGQVFRTDSISMMSNDPLSMLHQFGTKSDSVVTLFADPDKMRGGWFGGSSIHDQALAFLGFSNSHGYDENPWLQTTCPKINTDDGTIIEYVEWETSNSAFALDNAPLQLSFYVDFSKKGMDQAYIDSVSNAVQHIGTGGAPLLMYDGSLVTASSGDLNQNGFNEREGAYILKASNNTVHFYLPARGDTCRFYPAFRITEYYASHKPQYLMIYQGANPGDTLTLIEGYHYNLFHNKQENELVIQIDTVFCDTVGIYLSSDITLAVTLSEFTAVPGDASDTLLWKTESEFENLGFHIYRRICPEFIDSLTTEAQNEADSVKILSKKNQITYTDSLWLQINDSLIPGAESGVSHGTREYSYIDTGLVNNVLYEYKLVAVDFRSIRDTVGYAQAMPRAVIPVNFHLGNNFPNPFRHITNIVFALPVESRVTLDIFDLRGRRVASILNAQKVYKPGVHRVQWNGRDNRGRPVAPGQYLYRFVTDGYVKTRKMIRF